MVGRVSVKMGGHTVRGVVVGVGGEECSGGSGW